MNRLIAPSVLAVWDKSGHDAAAVADAGVSALKAGADWVHVDVMDGTMVPVKTFGVEMVEGLYGRGIGRERLDVHLMVEKPEEVVQAYVGGGAGRVCFHPTFCKDVGGTLEKIKDMGGVAGLALDVDERASLLKPWLGKFGQVLVMTVKAGAGGQLFMPAMLEKVRAARAMCGPEVKIVVDGGVKAEVAGACWAAGADVLVAGSAVFNAPDVGDAIEDLRA